jgi:hypothetical protein
LADKDVRALTQPFCAKFKQMEILSLLLAFIIFVAIIYAVYKIVIFTQRNLKSVIHRAGIKFISYLALDVLSLGVGVWFVLLTWKWSETVKFIGFPIPAAVWQFSNGVWLDFISPISLLVWGLDFIIGIGIVHLPVALVLLMKCRKAKRLPKDDIQ